MAEQSEGGPKEFFLFSEGPFVVRVYDEKPLAAATARRYLEKEGWFGLRPTRQPRLFDLVVSIDSETVQSTWPKQAALISAYPEGMGQSTMVADGSWEDEAGSNNDLSENVGRSSLVDGHGEGNPTIDLADTSSKVIRVDQFGQGSFLNVIARRQIEPGLHQEIGYDVNPHYPPRPKDLL